MFGLFKGKQDEKSQSKAQEGISSSVIEPNATKQEANTLAQNVVDEVKEDHPSAADAAESVATPLLDTLAMLDKYNESHIKGGENVKSCLIQLSRARRKKAECLVNATAYTTDQLREEFVARALLTTTSSENDASAVPELETEDDTQQGGGVGNIKQPTFTLHLNGIPKETLETGKHSAMSKGDKKADDGLRQRKGAPSATGTNDKEEWTVVTQHVPEKDAALKNMDPITLFDGMPPQALREAQKKARVALEQYVSAANAAAEILKIIDQSTGQSKA